ncbi:MAG: hypothetical protein DLM72_16935 [Candidatus Nitrosopolaris wilkensis]|nr:MAG: hypothetical protein DLM72_16935 [Candidatus Nitrosopolaris wilkensis]
MVEPKTLIKNTIQIIQNFQKIRHQIMDEHFNFDKIKDSRITVFTNCIVALDGVCICFIVRNFELCTTHKKTVMMVLLVR